MSMARLKICVISITAPGKILAEEIRAHLPSIAHQHIEKNLAGYVSAHFQAWDAMIFLCATGIATRMIAPHLTNKSTDPAVLVMDEKRRWVIPILGAHEKKANSIACMIARKLQLTPVLTSQNTHLAWIDVIGLGCEKNCPFPNILQLWQQLKMNYPWIIPQAIASIDAKAHEPALVKFAQYTALPLLTFSADQLNTYQSMLTERSALVHELFGCYSVAESAALYGASTLLAGELELLVAKQKGIRATIAAARVTEKSAL